MVDLSHYVTALDVARQLGAWGYAGMLSKTKVDRRPTHLQRALFSVAESPRGLGRLYDADWKKLDAEMETVAKLLMAAIQDKHCIPLTKRKWTGGERDRARFDTLFEQARIATECLDRLPKDGAGFSRVVDQADIRLEDASVRIYHNTRKVLFDKVGEALSSHAHRECADVYFEFLMNHMRGPYGGSASHAARREYVHEKVLVMMLQRLEHSDYIDLGSEESKLFMDLSCKWVQQLRPRKVARYAELELLLGKDFSDEAFLILQREGERLKRLEDAAKAFIGPYSAEKWVVDGLDTSKMEVVIAKFTHKECYFDSAKLQIEQLLEKATKAFPNVKFVILLWEPHTPDTVAGTPAKVLWRRIAKGDDAAKMVY